MQGMGTGRLFRSRGYGTAIERRAVDCRVRAGDVESRALEANARDRRAAAGNGTGMSGDLECKG